MIARLIFQTATGTTSFFVQFKFTTDYEEKKNDSTKTQKKTLKHKK